MTTATTIAAAYTAAAAMAAQTPEMDPTAPGLTPDGRLVVTTLIVCVLLMAVLTAAFTYRTRAAHPHRAASVRRYR